MDYRSKTVMVVILSENAPILSAQEVAMLISSVCRMDILSYSESGPVATVIYAAGYRGPDEVCFSMRQAIGVEIQGKPWMIESLRETGGYDGRDGYVECVVCSVD
jgi:hypothetical protein